MIHAQRRRVTAAQQGAKEAPSCLAAAAGGYQEPCGDRAKGYVTRHALRIERCSPLSFRWVTL